MKHIHIYMHSHLCVLVSTTLFSEKGKRDCKIELEGNILRLMEALGSRIIGDFVFSLNYYLLCFPSFHKCTCIL